MPLKSAVTDRDDKIDEILCAAVELATPGERADYVRQVCGDDEELLHRLERLIDAHFRAGNFLASTTVELQLNGTSEPFEQPGSTIGPYKLLQQIGEGGFAVVFMAEQDQPVRRRVAVKIIKPGMDSRQVIARFEAERQALAMMDHPNIAKVLDAGTTDAGRPYFVLELVKGVPITGYCDEHRLNIAQRLNLFSEVCQAVQHAHQKGIIHRDIKPSNVLVAAYDDQPIPKVIDFGVAKAISQPLTEQTFFTEFGQIIGTIDYMSPEQAKLNQLDIDTRSDIYSLGVLLYELLVGSTPVNRDRFSSAAFNEVLRIIGEEEPPTPSTRLSSSRMLPSISANRRTEPEKLTKLIRGDLDWIAMKCLEKERGRRYETANSLTRDIKRFLDNEPIEARPPSTFYRLKKFVRRNKAGSIATLVVLAVLIAGFVLSSWFYLSERQARMDAEVAMTSEKQMRLEYEASSIVDEARFLFRNRSAEAAEVQLSKVTPLLGELTGSHAAMVNARIGFLRAQKGQWKEAAECYTRSLETYSDYHDIYHFYIPVLLHLNELETYEQLRHKVYDQFGPTAEGVLAERLIKDCLAAPWKDADFEHMGRLLDRSLKAGPDHWAFGYFLFAKGLIEYRRGDFQEAVNCMEKTLARVHEDQNRDVQAYMVLAMAHFQLGNHDKAAETFATGSEFARQRLPIDGRMIDYQGWNDWVIAHELFEEADSLINGSVP